MYYRLMAVLLVLLFGQLIIAEEQTKSVKPLPLRCATTHYPPFTDFNTDPTNPTGFDIDILNAMARDFNWSLTIDNVPWQRVISTLHLNTYDCYFSMGKVGDRAVHVSFTETPLHITQYAAFSLKDRPSTEIKTYATLRGIPAPKGLQDRDELRMAKEVKANDSEMLVKLLLKQRVDVFITNSNVGLYLAEKHSISDRITRQVFHEFDLPAYLVFSKNIHGVDIDAVNQWLTEHIPPHNAGMNTK